jgi:FMN phosphatase YigB (HAD superfamily)
MPAEAAATLAWLRRQGIPLGIASNSQAYTLRELEEALAAHGLSLEAFSSDLCFWSFRQGFSKPDPHVFHSLTHRLAIRGIPPSGILMVGDRLDNDIQPARAFDWQTWQIAATGDGPDRGPGSSLLERFKASTPSADGSRR